MNSKSINIDFLVNSDLYRIKITDLSSWGISGDKPAIIEITPPGYKEPYFVQYFDKRDTVYDSNCLGMTCGEGCELVELNDGVWKIQIKASPSTFNHEVYYLKLDQFQKKLDKAFIQTLENECKDCKRQELIQLLFNRNLMESLVRSGDRKRAQSIYESSIKKIDKLINCKEC